MNDINRCPNHELLVTFLYDECEPAERDSIAAHLALCGSCAEDVQGLRDARVHLAAWSAPALPLGFQLTRTESEPPSKVLASAGLAGRSSQSEAGWWRQPLPAWAQAAAAAVIFAAGMSAGALRSTDPADKPANVTATPSAVVAEQVVAPVSQDDFDSLEARLQSIERQQAQPDSVHLARSTGGVDERAMFENLSALLDTRITQGERQNMRLVAQELGRLEAQYEQLSARTDVLEEDSTEFRRVGTWLANSPTMRSASLQR